MDRRRAELLTLLQAAASGLADLRIAAYRGYYGRLPELAAPIRDLLPKLGMHEQPAPA